MVKLLSIMDPVGRYAEHKKIKAFAQAEVSYYQGTDFISRVEDSWPRRSVSFSAALSRVAGGFRPDGQYDRLQRPGGLPEPFGSKERAEKNPQGPQHHIIKGGHLSSQPMGALRDYVARNPKTGKAAVVHFPGLKENPYKTDLRATGELLARHRPELIILGKSLVLHREPVAEIRAFVDELDLDCLIMYDMAHVLGLVGPYFQKPFQEGADIVTGSTHKTYFGTQRGIIASSIGG